MNTAIRSSLAVLFAAGGMMGASQVFAAGPAMQMESSPRITCDGVLQDRSACLREAGAARYEAGRGGLTSAAPASYEQNALARCALQQPADQAACEARIRGTGTTTIEGSVLGGGVVRETVTPVPMPAR